MKGRRPHPGRSALSVERLSQLKRQLSVHAASASWMAGRKAVSPVSRSVARRFDSHACRGGIPALQRTSQGPAPRHEEVRPRQGFGGRVGLERRGIAQRAGRIAGHQHGLDGVAVEPKMVVADGTLAQQLSPSARRRSALGLLAHHTAPRSQGLRPAELSAHLAADRQRLAQRCIRIGATVRIEQEARPCISRFCASNCRAPSCRMSRISCSRWTCHRRIGAQLVAREDADRLAQHLCPRLPDQRRGPGQKTPLRAPAGGSLR